MRTYRIVKDGQAYKQLGRNSRYAVAKLLNLPVHRIASVTKISDTGTVVSIMVNGQLVNFAVYET